MPYRHITGFYDPKYKANQKRRELEDLLAEWYDPVYARREVAAHAEKPRALGDVMNQVLQKNFGPEVLAAMQIRQRWNELIGPPLNRYAAFYAIEEHIGIIEVAHPAFLRELQKPDVAIRWVEKLNQEFPEAGITSLRFVPQGQFAPRRPANEK